MQVNKSPLLLPLLFLFLGGSFGYFFDPEIKSLLSVFCIVLLVLGMVVRYTDALNSIWLRIGTVGFLFFCFGLISFELENHQKATAFYDGQTVVVKAQVIDIKEKPGNSAMLTLHVLAQKKANRIWSTDQKIIVTVSESDRQWKIDDVLWLNATLNKICNSGNPGEFDAEFYYNSKQIYFRAYCWGEDIQWLTNNRTWNGFFMEKRAMLGQVMEEQLDGDFLGISKALLLGDKSDLDQEVMDDFSKTGSMHVLAVSGMHVGIILAMFLWGMQFASKWINRKIALLLVLIGVWFYGFLTGASPAVLRSVFMFSIVVLAELIQRKNAGINGLLISALILYLFDPNVMLDIGFQLTIAAMLGIFLIYPKIQPLFKTKNLVINWFWEGTAVGIAATISTLPLTLYWFHQFPNYFLLSNLGVMLFGTAVLFLGVIFVFTLKVPFLKTIIAVLFSFSIVGLLVWVNWVAELPGSVSTGIYFPMWMLVTCSVLILVPLFFNAFKWQLSIVIGCCLFGFSSFQRFSELNSSGWCVLNAHQPIFCFYENGQLLGLYVPKYGHADKTPNELKAFAREKGFELKAVSINEKTKIKFGKHQMDFENTYGTIQLMVDQRSYVYASEMPSKLSNQILIKSYKWRLFETPKDKLKPVNFKW